MKKLILLLVVTLMTISCKEERNSAELKQINWTVEVTYLDDNRDTLEMVGYDTPHIYISEGVSTLVGESYRPVASYVKKIKIIKEDEIKLH